MTRVQSGAMRRAGGTALAALGLSIALGGPAAAQFVAEETEVCPASAQVYDPEFDFASQQIAYFDGRGGVRVAPVAADGAIDSPGCAGVLVSRQASIGLPDLPFRSGPEWAYSSRGRELFFTRLDSQGRPYIARAWFDGRWRQQALADSPDRGLPLVSADAADSDVRLVYMVTTSPGSYTLAWREAMRPETEALLPGRIDPKTGGAPRWVPGERALAMSLPDAAGVRQAARYDIDLASVEFLTSDASPKDEIWLWRAPEFGGEMALLVVADGCCLRVYRQAAGEWMLYRELAAREFSPRPAIISPEILVLDGKSYIAMQLARQRTGASEIWVVAVDPLGMPPVKVSDDTQAGLSRSEPEWMVTPAGVYVYASASTSGSRFALHRMKTPLSPPR